MDFIQSLFLAAGLEEDEAEELRTLIANRNFFGVEEVLDHMDVADSVKEAFHLLPELIRRSRDPGSGTFCLPRKKKASQAIHRLKQIDELLHLYGVEDHVTFDLSMSGSYGYYTGIIFRAYTYGTGDAVVRGGRYDHLLEKFGKNTPSIGFAIILDELMNALNRQNIQVETGSRNLLVYTQDTEKWAISLARTFRNKGKNIEMLKRNTDEDRQVYEEYGKRSSVMTMLYLRDDLKIEMINFRTGEKKIMDTKKQK